MTYHRKFGRVQYQSKDGSQTKVFDALEWLAAMCSHVPNKGEQMVRYYGYYSNANRGRRKKALADDQTPYILEPELSPKEFRRSWARLIQKIYGVDPLTCAKCQRAMRIMALPSLTKRNSYQYQLVRAGISSKLKSPAAS